MVEKHSIKRGEPRKLKAGAMVMGERNSYFHGLDSSIFGVVRFAFFGALVVAAIRFVSTLAVF